MRLFFSPAALPLALQEGHDWPGDLENLNRVFTTIELQYTLASYHARNPRFLTCLLLGQHP